MNQLSNDEIMQVTCPRCDSAPFEACKERDGSKLIGGYHKERVEFREKLPVLPKEIPSVLTPTDKAILTYYAFVMLADSCAANSEKLFGKKYTSQEIQRTFGKAAIKKAQEDGLLGLAPEETAFVQDAVVVTHHPVIVDPICTQCNRPFSHQQHTPGTLAYHPPVNDGHVANRQERRSPEYKRKFDIM